MSKSFVHRFYENLKYWKIRDKEVEIFYLLFSMKLKKSVYKSYLKLKMDAVSVLGYGLGYLKICEKKGMGDMMLAQTQIEVLLDMIKGDWEIENRVIRKR